MSATATGRAAARPHQRVLAFTSPDALDPAVAGGKAASLARLAAAERTRARPRPVLDEGQALAIAELAAGVEESGGRPQDIEWAIHDGRIHVLQSRPITALPAAPVPIPVEVPPGDWDRDDHHGVLSPLAGVGSRRTGRRWGAACGRSGCPYPGWRCASSAVASTTAW